MERKILVVDDEQPIRLAVTRRLQRLGFDCVQAADGEAAIEAVAKDRQIGVALIDIRMPGKSGLDVIAEIKSNIRSDIGFIVITGHGGFDEAVEALRLGASDFLTKPFSSEQLEGAIRKCLEGICSNEGKLQTQRSLEAEVMEKTERISALAQEVDSARIEALESLAIAAEHRDNDTGEHIRRIGIYAEILALGLGWSEALARKVRLAATLHDIGKIGVPDNILMKPGLLTEAEIATMQAHTRIGHEIVSPSTDEIMKVAATIALSHHERWDGSGYPYNLAGEAIPIEARIAAVCDVYDALRSPRPYKPAMDHRTAVRVILEGDVRTRPQHFDPAVLEVFGNNAHRLAEAYGRRPDVERKADGRIASFSQNGENRGTATFFGSRGKANAI
ncbi:HD domain-containing phosphohydrolase [Shumkonia mesophila]|uniref:HD domain-containing phosphohydrolase n=1 Tax=Shumkonia mesophila TaxID=2838854 RepID=UPI0029348B83|nr:HD domain-containing phosphohydrolase [Shumkonia mesophila]